MTKMDKVEYDLIVIGSGAGLNVASNAHSEGMRVALLDDGPIGGTCLNRGCVPTKVLLYPAEVVSTVRHARSVGVNVSGLKLDFELIMKRMHRLVDKDRISMERGLKNAKGFDFFNSVGTFVGEKTLKVYGKIITAPRILIASGAREDIPPIPGLSEAGFITSTSALELKKAPGSLVMIGGGYIACEMGHFFASVGTKVTIVGRNERILPHEEPEISEVVKEGLMETMTVLTNTEVVRAGRKLLKKFIIARDKKTGKETTISADEIMIASGRRSNSDLLKPEVTGVKVDEKGWIVVDRFLRTNVQGIYALGDALGKNMFRHTANHQSGIVWNNMMAEDESGMEEFDEHAIPHAVFTYPEVASVGSTEGSAMKDHLILVGINRYHDTVKGYAMDERNGFFKVILDAKTREILGAHAVGPNASVLIHPIIYLMNSGDRTYKPIAISQTIHPSLSEVMAWAFSNLRPGKGQEKSFGHHHHHEDGHDHGSDHEHGPEQAH
jgi:mycothione reductase